MHNPGAACSGEGWSEGEQLVKDSVQFVKEAGKGKFYLRALPNQLFLTKILFVCSTQHSKTGSFT